MPTEPTQPGDAHDLEVEVEVEEHASRSAPTMYGPAQGGGARFTRTPSPARSEGSRSLVRLLPGRRVPNTRYRLVRWLGEGGMGVVYEAEHEDIERRIALKILRHEASQDPEQAARFREEARAASKIGSPNIVQIFDFGELPDGRLMFFMDLLAGQGLDTEIDAAPMDQERLIAILRQVCKGLAAAHDAGIVHRDIKPDNVILIREGGRSDFVKIVDFGIATILTTGGTSAPAAGTPQYMAPEQILGQAVDGRLDIYAVGCMAYELLTGHPPFHEGGIEEILEQQLTTLPQPLQEQLTPEQLHPALATVLMRCLAKQPEQRYHDARDLEAALCEAQIAAGIRTSWDDLPLPDVEPERRANLAAKMPRLAEDLSTRRRWLWPLVAVAGILIAVVVTIALTPPQEIILAPGEEAIVEERERLALDAAARTYWVYPEDSKRAEDTAYRHVLTLESLEGSIADLGKERALELREKFFHSLRKTGDRSWEEGARAFAADFYAQAILFAFNDDLEAMIPDLGAASEVMERTGMTRGMISRFFRDAKEGTFSESEVYSAKLVSTLAEPDEELRNEKIKSLTKKSGQQKKSPLSATQLSQLTKLARVGDDEPDETPPGAETRGDDEGSGQEGGDETPESAAATTSKSTSDSATKTAKRDPATSRKLASQAASALASGQRKKAEELFHQALSYDNRNAAALIGLSDIHFDRSNYQQTVQYAKKAVQAAPKKASYRIRLGDAYFKLLRYTDALAEYEAAKKYGSKEASGRIDKVNARLGK